MLLGLAGGGGRPTRPPVRPFSIHTRPVKSEAMVVEVPVPQVIEELKGKGWRPIDIARTLGATLKSVQHWSLGHTRPRLHRRISLVRMLAEEPPAVAKGREAATVPDAITALMAMGWPVNVIAKRMGVHRHAVQRWKDGISAPRNAHRILQMLEERPPPNNHKTLLRLMSHYAEDGVYDQGYEKLASRMGVEYSYISKLCRKLSQQGFITRLETGPSRSARWRVNAQE